MSYLVCWFQAPVEDAAAIRTTVTTGARKREEWPYLVVSKVDAPDVNKLERLARPKRPKGSSKIGGQTLDRSKYTDTPFTGVSRVNAEFLAALTALDDAGVGALGRAWSAAIDGVAEEAAVPLVAKMVAFARQAEQSGLPVLELDVM